MRSQLISMLAVVLVVGSSLVYGAEKPVPAQQDIMPVMLQLENNGKQFPVVAKKDGDFFQVFLVKGGTPYFADKKGESHHVFSSKGNFPIYYVDTKDGKPNLKEINEETLFGKLDEEPKNVRTVGTSEGELTKVCWGWGCRRRVWYGYGYGGCYYRPYYYGGCGGYGCGGYSGGYYGGGYYGGYGYDNYMYYPQQASYSYGWNVVVRPYSYYGCGGW